MALSHWAFGMLLENGYSIQLPRWWAQTMKMKLNGKSISTVLYAPSKHPKIAWHNKDTPYLITVRCSFLARVWESEIWPSSKPYACFSWSANTICHQYWKWLLSTMRVDLIFVFRREHARFLNVFFLWALNLTFAIAESVWLIHWERCN